MNLYRTARLSATTVHQDLLAWARERLRKADLYGVECLGQIPAGNRTDPTMILMPFRVGADPKMTEMNHAVVPMGQENNDPARAAGAPDACLELAVTINRCFNELFPQMAPQMMRRPEMRGGAVMSAPLMARTPLADLPEPMQRWYNERTNQHAEGEKSEWVQEGNVRLPRMGWLPGIPLLIRYIALAAGQLPEHDPTTSPPLGVPALAVLSAAIFRERFFEVSLPLPDPPDELPGLVEALAESFEGRCTHSADLRRIWEVTRGQFPHQVAILPQGEIANSDIAGLLQALQQPLQSAMSFQLRFQSGGEIVLRPGIASGEAPRPGVR